MPTKKSKRKPVRVKGTVPMRRQKTPPSGQGPVTPGPIIPDDHDDRADVFGDGPDAGP